MLVGEYNCMITSELANELGRAKSTIHLWYILNIYIPEIAMGLKASLYVCL